MLPLVLWPQMALSQPLCPALDALIASVPTTDVVTFPFPGQMASTDCTRSLELGGTRAVTCGLVFPYRDDQADVAFEGLLQDVAACGEAAGRDQALVSHPDSYDLRMFRVGAADVNVSLKDKGALEKTWVFLRVATALK